MKLKTKAIKQARNELGQLFKMGEEYKFLTYDEEMDSHTEHGPWNYWSAAYHRSNALVRKALKAMGRPDYESVIYYGGNWTEYLEDDK